MATEKKLLSLYRKIANLLTLLNIDRALLKSKSGSSYLTQLERKRLQELDYRILLLKEILEELEQ